MRTRYTLKAVKKATEISSVVKVWVGDGTGSDLGVKEKEGVPNAEGDRGKIVRLEDRWNGKLPEGVFSEVCSASVCWGRVWELSANALDARLSARSMPRRCP